MIRKSKLFIYFFSVALLFSACVTAPPQFEGNPICVSGTGHVEFQVRSNLYRMTPEDGGAPVACEVRTFACEGRTLIQRDRQLLNTACQ